MCNVHCARQPILLDVFYTVNLQKTSFHNATHFTHQIYRKQVSTMPLISHSKSTEDKFPQCDSFYTANLQKTSFHNATYFTQQIYRRQVSMMRLILYSKSTEDRFPQCVPFFRSKSTVDKFPQCDRLYTANLQKTTDFT